MAAVPPAQIVGLTREQWKKLVRDAKAEKKWWQPVRNPPAQLQVTLNGAPSNVPLGAGGAVPPASDPAIAYTATPMLAAGFGGAFVEPAPLHCDDRIWHPGAAAALRCAHANLAPWPFPIPNALVPGRPQCLYGGPPGANNHHPDAATGPPYLVCDGCEDQTTQQAWYNGILQDIDQRRILTNHWQHLAPSPLPIGLAAEQAWAANPAHAQYLQLNYRGFLTYLCEVCEKDERIRLHTIVNGPLAVPPPAGAQLMLAGGTQLPAAPGAMNVMRGWPYNACTCYSELRMAFRANNPNAAVCVRHRFTRSTALHNERLAFRLMNDKWLRMTGRNEAGKAIRVHGNVTNARARRGLPRACRCGREIRGKATWTNPIVAMCLGCEGVVHLLPHSRNVPAPPGSAAHVPAAWMTRQAVARAAAREGDLSLRRPWA